MSEKYNHRDGMAGGMHESYPDIGDGMTPKHGSPSPTHDAGVHRFINKTPHPMHMSSVK